MCGALEQGSLDKSQCIHDKTLYNPKYFPKPFVAGQFEPFEWPHILSNLFVCKNKVMQRQFYDKEGNDIVPPCTIMVNNPREEESVQGREPLSDTKENPLGLMGNKAQLNWISGCRVQTPGLSLTNKMVERVHVVRNSNKVAKLQLEETQATSKERMQKNKQ